MPAACTRAADAVEKITRRFADLLRGLEDRVLTEVAAIGQQEVRWHVAHPGYRHSADTRRAAELVKSRSSAGTSTLTVPRRRTGGVFSYPFGVDRPTCWPPSTPSPGSASGPGEPRHRPRRGLVHGNQEPGGLSQPRRNRPKGPHCDLWVG